MDRVPEPRDTTRGAPASLTTKPATTSLPDVPGFTVSNVRQTAVAHCCAQSAESTASSRACDTALRDSSKAWDTGSAAGTGFGAEGCGAGAGDEHAIGETSCFAACSQRGGVPSCRSNFPCFSSAYSRALHVFLSIASVLATSIARHRPEPSAANNALSDDIDSSRIAGGFSPSCPNVTSTVARSVTRSPARNRNKTRKRRRARQE